MAVEGKVTARVLALVESLPPDARRRVARHVFEAYGDPGDLIKEYERTRKSNRTFRETLPEHIRETLPEHIRETLPGNSPEDTPKRTKVLSTSGSYLASPGFCSFWLLYPKRVGKGEAFKAWSKGNCEVLSSVVIKAVREQNGYLIREGGQFTPLPATWLNQRRWEDEPPAPSALSSKTAGNVESLRRAAIRLKGGDPDATP